MKLAKVGVKFEPRDAWVGLFWDHKERSAWATKPIGDQAAGLRAKFRRQVRSLHLYLCPVPFLVLHAEIELGTTECRVAWTDGPDGP